MVLSDLRGCVGMFIAVQVDPEHRMLGPFESYHAAAVAVEQDARAEIAQSDEMKAGHEPGEFHDEVAPWVVLQVTAMVQPVLTVSQSWAVSLDVEG